MTAISPTTDQVIMPGEEVTTDLLPESPNFENIRQSIAARCVTTASDKGWTDSKPLSGEILKAAMLADTQAVIVFEVKYGEKPGYRTIVYTRPDSTAKFSHVTTAFATRPGLAERVVTKVERATWVSVIDFHPEVQSLPMSPADGTSTVMSYTYHVRSLGDNHVICSTTTLADAKRIVAALGNCAVFQFRDSRSYDDTTTWIVQ